MKLELRVRYNTWSYEMVFVAASRPQKKVPQEFPLQLLIWLRSGLAATG
jgi:hypothetical protein